LIIASRNIFQLGVFLICLLMVAPLFAHHILGRPSYNLNEDSNTPPSMQAELQAGSYEVLYMAYPAFPKANERGRINIHASHIVTGETFVGKMTFRVNRDPWFPTEWFPEGWFSTRAEQLGVQKIDDGVYRQGFVFDTEGDYIIQAEFSEGEHTHTMSFPLRVGVPPIFGLSVYVIGTIVILLLGLSIIKRKKLQQGRIKRHYSENNDPQITSRR
jgi:hypothetical protein